MTGRMLLIGPIISCDNFYDYQPSNLQTNEQRTSVQAGRGTGRGTDCRQQTIQKGTGRGTGRGTDNRLYKKAQAEKRWGRGTLLTLKSGCREVAAAMQFFVKRELRLRSCTSDFI
eukprot:gene4918-115_t